MSAVLKDCSLRWKPLSEWAAVDESGIFYVGKVSVNGVELFECWAKPDKSKQAICLRQNLPDGQSAKDWASSFALSYRNGTVSLKAPLTKAEIEEARRCGEASK
jgi:hypothetical protein